MDTAEAAHQVAHMEAVTVQAAAAATMEAVMAQVAVAATTEDEHITF